MEKDGYGLKEKLHSILRTTKDNINFIVMKMPDEYKRTYDGKLYIRGFKVMEQIIKSEEENGTGTKELTFKPLNNITNKYTCVIPLKCYGLIMITS